MTGYSGVGNRFGQGEERKRFVGCRLMQLLLCAFLICLQLVCGCSLLWADTDVQAVFQKAVAPYEKVRRVDSGVSDLKRWEDAASELQKFLRDNPRSKQTPKALFALGELYRATWEKRQYRAGLTQAVFAFERMARDFQGHELTDDALLVLGDLRRNALKDEAAARSAYFEIVDVYSRGDKVREARKRLGMADASRAVEAKQTSAAGKKSEPSPSPSASPQPSSTPPASGLLSVFGFGRGEEKQGREIISQPSEVKRPLIVIDPGHGGDEEEGAIGVDGLMEKEIVLNICMLLDELLRERLRAKTVLTRARDMALPLADRAKIANEQGADLFISVHTNASVYHNAKGIETYYLDNTDDKQSLRLAQAENISLGKSVGDLDFIISDLIQASKMEESITLAHYIQRSLVATLSRYYTDVKDLGVKKAPFYVLMGAHMPAVLVEVSFIDHPVEGKRLAQRRYQKLIARALFLGIRDYFERQ